jgi:hypothetical protein
VTRQATTWLAHANFVEFSLPLVLVVGVVGGAVLLALAAVAYTRRQSVSYLLLTVAVAALVGRVVVGGLAVGGMMDYSVHHLVEHGLDVVTLAAVVGAVYLARQSRGEAST